MRTRRTRGAGTQAVLLAMLCAAPLWACNVPVFRYALEQWPPDFFRLAVIHDGPLTDAQTAMLAPLENPHLAEAAALNVWVKREAGTATAPRLVLRAPGDDPVTAAIWEAPLSAEALAQVRHSPARVELAKRLLDGDSVVWVLLRSGDPAADDAARAALTPLLARLEGAITLPELEDKDLEYLSDTAPKLELRFSMLEVDRTDAREAILRDTILSHAPASLTDAERAGPLLVPVFGRGRALAVVPVGGTVDVLQIEYMADFMCGPCSCQVKEENPGFDLLIAAGWADKLSGKFTMAEALPTLSTPTQAMTSTEAAERLAVETDSAVATSPQTRAAVATYSPMMRNVVIAIVAFFVVVAAASVWMRRRMGES